MFPWTHAIKALKQDSSVHVYFTVYIGIPIFLKAILNIDQAYHVSPSAYTWFLAWTVASVYGQCHVLAG